MKGANSVVVEIEGGVWRFSLSPSGSGFARMAPRQGR